MKAFSFLIVAALFVLPSSALAQKDEIKKKLVGKWEAILQDAAKVDFKFTTDFKADGKMEVKVKDFTLPGTWDVSADGKSIETETILPDGVKKTAKQAVKVDGDTLELTDKDGQVFKLKRIK